jgi:hypothetical protein
MWLVAVSSIAVLVVFAVLAKPIDDAPKQAE